MISKIINFSIKNKLIVILFTLSIVGFGLFAISQIPVGAVPDITNNQVQVITTSSNLSTQDIEQFITAPVELEMANLPGVKEIRSISKFGLSVVTIVFEDNLGTYLPRQLLSEKIKTAAENIPKGFGSPGMGPITTGLGEIYQYVLDVKPGYENKYSLMDLRTIQDWIVKRQLSGIPGVVEVNTWGGYLKQYEVAINPEKLKNMGVSLIEVFNALEKNNNVAGGAYIEKENQSYFIRGDGMVKSIDDIKSIVVKNDGLRPILIGDIAEVNFGHANRFGAITANGEGEKVLGQIMMLKDANSKKVINDVKNRINAVQKTLPEGIFINPILERSELIGKTTLTVSENLILGFIIVMLVVLLLLGNLRPALVIASMIPLALLFTLSMMYIFGIDVNLMSLGALDFGIIIDGAVIIVEFIAIRITANRSEYEQSDKDNKQTLLDKISFEGASKMMNSAIFGQVIILIVFIPILSLSGVEGKMFRPMALAFSFALIGAMIFGLTWLPVATSMFLRPEKENKKNIANWIMDKVHRSYSPVIIWSYDHKKTVFGLALASLVLTGFIFTKIGGEFVPTLDEGDFVIQPVLKTGTSLSKTIELTTKMENILIKKFPEVKQIVSRIGAAEVPTDPMSMEEVDMIIKLKPKNEWVSASSKEELAEKFKQALSVIPGIEYEFTQPIEMRFNELITGVRADIAVKIFGEDLNYLNEKAIEIKKLIENVPGASDVILEKTAGLPQMSVKYKRDKLAYYGLSVDELNKYLSMAFSGEMAGNVFEGERRFDLVVRYNNDFRKDIDDIKMLTVTLPNGSNIPFSELADITYTTGPAKISRDNTHRRVVVSVNVRNRDLESVVKDIQAKINSNITLAPGNTIEYGGQFENLKNATSRLTFAVPIALLLIFIFLHFAFKSFKDALMIFSAVPLSIVGGVLLLWIRGLPFSVSAGVGFIALFGVAVLNGIVLIEHLKDLEHKGITDIRELILKGTKERLRPVLLTASAAALGFLPMAISTSVGAEVQRPLATVVIGGLVTSTLLTMIALPLLYSVLFNVKKLQLFPLKIIRNKTLTIILFILIPSLVSFAQTKEITLEQALKIAIENNKELKAYSLKIEQNEVLKPSAYNFGRTSFFYGYDQNNIAENGHPLYTLGVEQSFSFPTVYFAQHSANSINVSIAKADYERQKRLLTKKVSQAYYNILYLLNKQKQYQFIDSIYSKFTNAAELMYRQGEISYLESLNAKAKEQELLLRLSQLKKDIEIAFGNLKALMQSNEEFSIPFENLYELKVNDLNIETEPGFILMKENVNLQDALLSVEWNKLLPDFKVSYFNGTNRFPNAKNYYSYQIGLSIPLFFNEQKARIQSNQVALSISSALLNNYKILVNNKASELKIDLKKYEEAISYYHSSGETLANEILKYAQKSYSLGEIDFFRFIQSIETAIDLKIGYLDNLSMYNNLVLEINYLTI
ncbi:Putative silver efflux pump [Ignavibacterium album JCM 16511]|uniref:Putative silver efflux pump n=1 Tax=Ignavibacterium album (strain DSM 19864 / JCM 16511 / NBRC 101810 / Mat9-16) TaxID=945713 RepID=I0AIN2_IGNAJ|nr:CusA/CzcA family heavy metal efflux RND transporter [Ignavibacterium album]AFH48839.1 Putative silver efflux pump [Ignavibacterium album JCM 16511]